MFRRNKRNQKKNYAFIDSQNLNLGVQRAGWKMDWKKFRAYLQDKYQIEKAYMFIGYLPENEDLYNQMKAAGYTVVLKPTLEMMSSHDAEKKDEKLPTKGNVDAELVMYVMKEISNYNKAIIVSGDGDFYSLIEYLSEKNKLLNVMVPNWKYSSLLKAFDKSIVRLDVLRNDLSYRNYNKSRSGSKHGKK
ncbi:NYN domain-containing protein [Candidatus Saccharibacteria bacterium]|nr:NYN domain-containing protein [Candidatus Saccharibacteria bacterium]